MVLESSASLVAIPPFFEPGAPPPTLPILIAHTEVGSLDTHSRLLAQEEIGSGPTAGRSSRLSRYTPYLKSAPKKQRSLPVTPGLETLSEQDETDSDSMSVASIDNDQLIPKPEGEAGRPGRGGYNLEDALKWDHKKYLKVKKYVKKLVTDCLDPTKNFTAQQAATIRVVQQLAGDKFPELHDYASLWPVTDMIRLHLKYTSGRARTLDKVSIAQIAKRKRVK